MKSEFPFLVIPILDGVPHYLSFDFHNFVVNSVNLSFKHVFLVVRYFGIFKTLPYFCFSLLKLL
jgi:hypothetical protein